MAGLKNSVGPRTFSSYQQILLYQLRKCDLYNSLGSVQREQTVETCFQVTIGARAQFKERANGVLAMVSHIEAVGEGIPAHGMTCAQGTVYNSADQVPLIQYLTCSENAWGRFLQISKTGGRMDLAEVAVKYNKIGKRVSSTTVNEITY